MNSKSPYEDLFPFTKLLGVRITKTDPDLIEAEMVVREDLCTSGEMLHGGAVMAFADSLGGIVTIVNLPEDAKRTATMRVRPIFSGQRRVAPRSSAGRRRYTKGERRRPGKPGLNRCKASWLRW